MEKKLIYKSENLEWFKFIDLNPKKIQEDEYIEYYFKLLVKCVWGFIFAIFFGCTIFIFSV